MKRLRPLALTSLCVLASCNPPDTALRVSVTIRSQGTAKVRADCLKLAVLDGTTSSELKSVTIKRPADDTALFGVRRGSDLPQSVKFQVTGLLGTCSDEANLKLNALSEQVPAVFPQSGVQGVDVFLDPPSSTLDADHDGFVSALKGGVDCKDDDSTIFPNAGQVCANTADTDCDGQGGCDDTECGSAPVCVDPPDRVAVTANFSAMLRYECRGPIRVELQNANGPRIAVRDTTVTFASSLMGMSVHGVANCNDTALTSLPIPYGNSFVEVYLAADDKAFGMETLTATATQVATPGSVAVDVHPQPVDHLAFTSMPFTTTRALTAGVCATEPLVLEFRDAMNRHTDVDSPTTVQLTSTPGDVNNANIFFSEAACGTDGSMPMLQAGQGTVNLFVLAKRAGSFSLLATPSTGTSATQMLTVLPNVASQLAFTNTPLALRADLMCSVGALNVQLQDQFHNAAKLSTDLQVRVGAVGLTGVSFSGTSNCIPALTDYTLPMNTSDLVLYANGYGVGAGSGSVQLSATNNASIADATQLLSVSSGPATRYTWNGTAQSPIAGQCSANPLTLTLTDSSGAVAPANSTITFNLAAVPASGDATFRFFSNPGCVTDLNNQVVFQTNVSSATVYFRGNKAVTSFEIAATGTSLVGPATRALNNSIRAASPSKLVFTTPLAQTAQAGVCTASPYTANVLDQYDNPTSFTTGQTVTVASSPPGVTVGQGACDTASSVPLAAGATSATFSARHTVTSAPATPYTLTATVAGFSTVPGATLTVTPGPSSLIVDTPAGGTASLSAGACQNITISRRDAFNNAAPVAAAAPLTLSFPASTQWLVYPAVGCMGAAGAVTMAANTNSVSFSLSPRTAGTHVVNASIGAAATLQSVPMTFTVAPGTPTLVFETPATNTAMATATQTAGGCTQVTVARKDSFGNDVPLGAAKDLTFTLPTGTSVHAGTPCVPGNVISLIPLTATDVRTTFYVKATQSSLTGGPAVQTVSAALDLQTASLSLTVNPGAPILAFVTPALGAGSLVSDQCQLVTLERRDALGNLVPVVGGTPVVSFAAVSGAVFTAFDSMACTGVGTAVSVPVTPLASSKTFSIRAPKAGAQAVDLTLEGQTVRLTLNISPGLLSKLIVEGLPANITAGACSPLLDVRRQDSNSNDITADGPLTVTISSSRFNFSNTPSTCAGAVSGATVTIPMGSAVSTDSLYATGTLAGATTVVANSTSPTATGSAPSTIGASTATQIAFLATPPASVTAGACSGSVQVELRDTFGNQVTPGAAYQLTLSSSSGAVFNGGAACTTALPVRIQPTPPPPVATFSFRPLVASASEVITVSGTGPVLSNTQTWNVIAAGASKLAWKQNPVATSPRFACSSAGVLQTQDPNGNPSAVASALTVTPTATSTGGFTFFSDAACTTPLTTFNINAGATDSAEFFFFATGAGSVTVAATAPSFAAAPNRTVALGTNAGSLVVTPATPAVEAGACVQLTIERRDDTNAPLTTGTSLLSASVATAASVTLYSSSDCSTTVLPANFTIANGASTATVYARGRSAAATGATPTDNVFTASDVNGGSANGTTTLKVYPLVRRGACDVVGATPARCALSPPIPGNVITRSFLVFTSKGRPSTTGPNAIAPSDQNVECHLETGSTSADVVCTRVTNTGTMNVNYQVVSFGRDAANGGVTVQHVPNQAALATSNPVTITAVNTANSFILTSNTLSGAVNDGDGFPVVRFASTGAAVTSVEIVANTNTPTTRNVSLQVVTMAGAAVDHVSVTNPTETTGTTSVTTANTTRAFALTMAQVTANAQSANMMCKRRFDTKALAGAAVTMHRGNAGANCLADAVALVNVQRVQVPGAGATVQFPAVAAITANGTGNNSSAFTAVAMHRSIAFLMTQGPGGQTAGESNSNGTGVDNDDTSSFHAIVDFVGAGPTATTVSVTRDATGPSASSVFSPVVVQFDP